MRTLFSLFHLFCSLPLSVYVNFKCLRFKEALRLPILIDYRTHVKGLKRGCFDLKVKSFGSVKIGWGKGSVGNPCNQENYLIVNGTGQFIFEGQAQFAMGVTLRSDNGGIIKFGKDFRANQNFTCFSNTIISFGDRVVTGWNVNVRDSDGHDILKDGVVVNPNKPITIGNHVWIASHVDILKGSVIGNENVVGFRSLVSGKFYENNTIIMGVPAGVKKQGFDWQV